MHVEKWRVWIILGRETEEGVVQCRQCGSKMFRSHHEEREYVGIYLVVKDVHLNECPNCETLVKIIIPAYFQRQAINRRAGDPNRHDRR